MCKCRGLHAYTCVCTGTHIPTGRVTVSIGVVVQSGIHLSVQYALPDDTVKYNSKRSRKVRMYRVYYSTCTIPVTVRTPAQVVLSGRIYYA